jgi:sugar/nucleoside kinase (ribokinase family)
VVTSLVFFYLKFLKCQGVKQVLVKLGSKGSALFIEGEEPIQQPAIFAKTVIDTTGAGDTFTAAFAVALVEGKSKKECLRFAGMCGRIYFACYLFWNFYFRNM